MGLVNGHQLASIKSPWVLTAYQGLTGVDGQISPMQNAGEREMGEGGGGELNKNS